MNELQIFKYQDKQIRTVERNGEPWWVLKDVCEVLEMGSPHKVAERLEEDERNRIPVTDSIGRQQETTIVNEAGLYNVILRSDKPQAKPFRRWVTNEVLPTIRKTGGYVANDDLFLNTYFPSADEATKLFVRTSLESFRRLNSQIAEMKPKALFADAVEASETSILIGDLAKLIKQNGVDIGQKRLFAWLRDHGYLIKSGASANMPTQKSMEQGLFEVKERTINNPDGSVRITRTTKVTGKGQTYFVNKFLS